MSEFLKLMLIVGVLSLIMGVLSIMGGAPTPGVFFILMGLLALGGTMATRRGMVDDLKGDVDKMVGTAGFGAAMGIGLAWLGMAAFAFNNSSTGAAEGHPDLQLWWAIIGTLLSIAGIGAMTGGLIHFRQQRG